MKIRKKPCRHCLFTKNAVVDHSTLSEQRALALSSNEIFKCHEHSCGTIACSSAYVRQPDRFVPEEVEYVNHNGDLKHFYSNMTKEERNKYTVG